MDETSIAHYITSTFDGVDVVEAAGDTFFFYDPGRKLPPDRRLPFATIVTGDRYDTDSKLDREGVFRLNVGARPETYRSMFGAPPGWAEADAAAGTGHDFAALDQVMPHPVYAPMSWVCVLNPSDATFEAMKALLAESYALAVRRYARRTTYDDPIES